MRVEMKNNQITIFSPLEVCISGTIKSMWTRETASTDNDEICLNNLSKDAEVRVSIGKRPLQYDLYIDGSDYDIIFHGKNIYIEDMEVFASTEFSINVNEGEAFVTIIKNPVQVKLDDYHGMESHEEGGS